MAIWELRNLSSNSATIARHSRGSCSTHEIIVRGLQLRRLETFIQRLELAWITALPERYCPLLGDGQPWIREIEVLKSPVEAEA